MKALGRLWYNLLVNQGQFLWANIPQPGVFATPFPYATQLGLPENVNMVDYCIRQLELLLHQQTAPRDTAAIIIEPVLGEGGYVVPPKGMPP